MEISLLATMFLLLAGVVFYQLRVVSMVLLSGCGMFQPLTAEKVL